MRHPAVLTLIILLAGSHSCLADASDQVAFIELPAFNRHTNAHWGDVLTDIMQHEAPGDSNSYKDLITLAHETTHGIHAYLRNHLNNTGKRANAFYVLDNRAVLVIEPNIRKRQIAAYVPASLHGMRYHQYITGQTAWDDTPLYVWDEWNAYVNGGITGVNLVNLNLWTASWQDGVSGSIEFNVYAIATAMAVKTLDPTYFASYPQFTQFLAWNLRRSMDTYKVGSKMSQFSWQTQDAYNDKLLHSTDAEKLRAFSREIFGSDWCSQVLGF